MAGSQEGLRILKAGSEGTPEALGSTIATDLKKRRCVAELPHVVRSPVEVPALSSALFNDA